MIVKFRVALSYPFCIERLECGRESKLFVWVIYQKLYGECGTYEIKHSKHGTCQVICDSFEEARQVALDACDQRIADLNQEWANLAVARRALVTRS